MHKGLADAWHGEVWGKPAWGSLAQGVQPGSAEEGARVYQECHVVCGIAGGDAETREVWVFGIKVGATQFEIRSAELAGPGDRSLPLTLGREGQDWMGLGFSTAPLQG